ncbi:hypothetical protein K4K58_003919 [Colletotrichum sp. SAR11_239]|nr:hypothetical protein K4K58_003919 [Colletotrichum sp. SAR11_239]
MWPRDSVRSLPKTADRPTDDDINDNYFEHSGLQQHGYIQFLYDRYSIQLIIHWSIHINHCFVEWNLHGNRQRFDNNSCVRDPRHFQLFKCFGFCSRHYQYTSFQFPELCDHDDFTVDINLYFFAVRQHLSFNLAIVKPYHSVWESNDRSQLLIEPNQKHKYKYGAPYHISAIFNDEFFFHYIFHQPDFTTFEFFCQLKRHLQPAFTSRIFIGNSQFICKLDNRHHFNTPIKPLQLIFWHFANSSVTFRVSAGILTRNARIVVFCPKFNRNI